MTMSKQWRSGALAGEAGLDRDVGVHGGGRGYRGRTGVEVAGQGVEPA
jgi:hypothetical protein